MGKQTNAQVLRFLKNGNWLSKYYSDFFNYSNLLIQDFLIREYIINILTFYNTKIVQIYIYRNGPKIIVKIFSYNDSFINYSIFLKRQKKKNKYKNRSLSRISRKYNNIFNFTDSYQKTHDWFKFRNRLSNQVIFKKNGNYLDYIFIKKRSRNIRHSTGYSLKRLLSLNLSYLLNTNLVIKNTNIINNDKRYLIRKMFWSMGFRLRSPLSKYLRVKFVCLVYYSLRYKSSILLCRYLRFIIPKFSKKKRKNRKVNQFFQSLKTVIQLLFLNGFLEKSNIKGIKISLKGRINGSRRKRIYTYKKGCTSTQFFNNEVSYSQEDCFTIFGVLGIKVWIIF